MFVQRDAIHHAGCSYKNHSANARLQEGSLNKTMDEGLSEEGKVRSMCQRVNMHGPATWMAHICSYAGRAAGTAVHWGMHTATAHLVA